MMMFYILIDDGDDDDDVDDDDDDDEQTTEMTMIAPRGHVSVSRTIDGLTARGASFVFIVYDVRFILFCFVFVFYPAALAFHGQPSVLHTPGLSFICPPPSPSPPFFAIAFTPLGGGGLDRYRTNRSAVVCRAWSYFNRFSNDLNYNIIYEYFT